MIDLLLQFIAAMFGVWAFAVIYRVPVRYYLPCAINGSIPWVLYLILSKNGSGPSLAVVCAAFTLTLSARMLAVLYKTPATIFLITGIFTLVPGTNIYYTAYYFMHNNSYMGEQEAFLVLSYAGSIAIGVLIGNQIPQKVFFFLSNLMQRDHQ